MTKLPKTILFCFICFLLVSCSVFQGVDEPTATSFSTSTEPAQETNTAVSLSNLSDPTMTPFQPVSDVARVYLTPAFPGDWLVDIAGIQYVESSESADLVLGTSSPGENEQMIFEVERIYALAAPFPTLLDGIRAEELTSVWKGESKGSVISQLLVSEETRLAFEQLWGPPSADRVVTTPRENLMDALWQSKSAFALIPFEEIQPKMKILKVNGISPLDRPMNVSDYALRIPFYLYGNNPAMGKFDSILAQLEAAIPATNRDESKMAVVIMTGTTALARVTLRKIDLNGVDYPVEMIKDWFLSADLRHVSNEVSFNENCVYTDPYTMQFCAKPEHIQVLEALQVNVVESTGNHLNDFGGDHFAKTLKMYEERGWLNFGGGYNAESARQPALTEVNGNRIAFIGCNPAGPATVWATTTRAGAAACDYDWFYQQIRDLKAQGYVVIATYQFEEISKTMYEGFYRDTFQEAANAGADIVQGSQAHVAMGFEFTGNTLIHYGLGNFLFDQMEPENIREFYDRHILYNGKYINTELLTARLTDWSRPVPMNESERLDLLSEIFNDSEMR